METLKVIGMMGVAAILAGITMVSGFIFSVVATVISVAVAIFGLLFGAFYLVWQAREDAKNDKDQGPD